MVKWTNHAKTQLRHLHDYIAQDSPIYARHVADALVRKTLALDQLPRIGRIVPEINEDTVREIPIYTYRLLYEITPEHIAVLAVIHKRRELQPDEIQRAR